jgi:hypothetical protein
VVVLTIIVQVRELISIVMVMHVKVVAPGFRRTRFEYGLVIWCTEAFVFERCGARLYDAW